MVSLNARLKACEAAGKSEALALGMGGAGEKQQGRHLGGEVTDDVGAVATPEGSHALLGVDPREAVSDACVAGDLSALDPEQTSRIRFGSLLLRAPGKSS